MLPPNNVAIRPLSQEEVISEATLHKWRTEARGKGQLMPDADAGREGWCSRDKFAAVLETAALNEADLAEYCCKRRPYPAQIAAWRSACEQANDRDRASSARHGCATKEEKSGSRIWNGNWPAKTAHFGISAAETAALLVLRKKAAAIWWGRRGRMISTPHRQTAALLINEAITAGARRAKACAELEISDRTLRRWTNDGQIHAHQRPLVPRPDPANKLSAEERSTVLDV
jgi:transposase-like protein